MLEIIVEGRTLDLPSDAKIKYTKRISDIHDIASVATSYTSSFRLEKTENNVDIFESLGLVGDNSKIPYRKVSARLLDNGVDVIHSGWLTVKDTSDGYDISIMDGMVDFFRAIENKTIGNDLDLSELDHEKDFGSIIATFDDSKPYKYIIADFGGKTETEISGDEHINIDYLVPSVRMSYLLNLIGNTFGYDVDLSSMDELDNMYITYPKDPASDVTYTDVAEMTKVDNGLWYVNIFDENTYSMPHYMAWGSKNATLGSFLPTGQYVVERTSTYRILASNVLGYLHINDRRIHYLQDVPLVIKIYINGQPIGAPIYTSISEAVTAERFVYASEGDVISFTISWDAVPPDYPTRISTLPAGEFSDWRGIWMAMVRVEANFKISLTNQGNISFRNAFKDFTIKDFFKECLMVTGNTPVLGGYQNLELSFVPLSKRMKMSLAQDLTEYYVERTKESYVPSGYAQLNGIRHKYNDPDDKSQDGYVYVQNENLEDEKTLFSSKIYAPERFLHTFYSRGRSQSFSTRRFRIWESQAKEASDGTITIEYKILTGRFYFLRSRQSDSGTWELGSDVVVGSESVDVLPYADTARTTYAQLVPIYFKEYNDMFSMFRQHDISMMLPTSVFQGLDLTRPVYFEQESAYYVLNQISFQSGGVSTGEFLKIISRVREELTGNPIQFSVRAYDGYAMWFKFPVLYGYNDIVEDESIITINGNDFEVVTYTVADGFITFTISIPVPSWQVEPVLNSFELKMSNGTDFASYTYDGQPVLFTLSDQYSNTTKTITAYIDSI